MARPEAATRAADRRRVRQVRAEPGLLTNSAISIHASPMSRSRSLGTGVRAAPVAAGHGSEYRLLPHVVRELSATDNLALTPADYTPYCITAPRDPRLPGGGGNQLCGLYDITPALFGRVDEIVAQASPYGKQKETFSGIDVWMTMRFGNGGQVGGGISVGRTVNDTCFVVDSPQQARPGYCRVGLPWWDGQGQLKFNAIYPLPWWRLQTSVTYQNLAGVPHSANYVATNAEV